MTDFSIRLGKRIRELRNKAGLSQDQLAEQAGISGKYFGEVERGIVNVSVVILAKLAIVLQVSLPELLALDHQETRPALHREILLLLQRADDATLRMIYRVLCAIMK